MAKSAKEYLEMAYEMKSAATGEYRKLTEKAKVEINAVKGDPDLSPQGREKKAEQLKRKLGVEVMRWAHTYRQMFRTEVEKARISAQKELDKAAPKVDPVKLERFEKEYKRTKTALMLASSTDKAARILSDFISKADESGLKALVADRYGELAENVLAVSGNDPKIRAEMSYQFEQIQREALTTEQAEAKQILDAAEGLEQAKVFVGIVEDNLSGLVGHDYGRFVNDTESFFNREENTEHKPDNYVHPEEVERKQRISDYKAEQEKFARIWEQKRERGELPPGW